MKKLARKMVAVVCAFSLLMGTGAVPVLAEEIKQESSLAEESDYTESTINDGTESIVKGFPEGQNEPEETVESNDEELEDSAVDDAEIVTAYRRN